MKSTRQFTARNESFTCNACGAFVERKLRRGYRNHCNACLASLHVDVNPGDRQASCGGIMDAVSAFQRHGEWYIAHRCRRCGNERNNRVADDDNREVLARLSAQPHTTT